MPCVQLLEKRKPNGPFELSILIDRHHHAPGRCAYASKPETKLNAINPRRLVIIGNYSAELNDDIKKTSFELFRGSLAGIDVITFDEFFLKIEHLAKLFNLARPMA